MGGHLEDQKGKCVGKWNAYSVWIGKLELQISRRRSRGRVDDNIKRDVK
jgi:hypothetical protein